MDQQYGVLHEVGDLGLGWNPFEKESDQKAYAESLSAKNDKDQQPINEENKQ